MIALDTSVAVPLLVQTHRAHADVMRWRNARDVALCGHALAETYSVLTRLPGDIRLNAADAAKLLQARFGTPILLSQRAMRYLPGLLSELDVAGGAVYDALVALTAREHGCELATRDARAKATYDAVGVRVAVAG